MKIFKYILPLLLICGVNGCDGKMIPMTLRTYNFTGIILDSEPGFIKQFLYCNKCGIVKAELAKEVPSPYLVKENDDDNAN